MVEIKEALNYNQTGKQSVNSQRIYFLSVLGLSTTIPALAGFGRLGLAYLEE